MSGFNFDDFMSKYSSKEKIAQAKIEKEKSDTPIKEKGGLLKNFPKIQRTLDLHGHTTNEAKREIKRFIENMKLQRIQTVKIITGRGWHSKDFKAVLPQLTEQLLAQLKKEGFIYQFKKEKTGGAFLVYIL